MNKVKPQNCPICGAGVLERRIGTETFEYKGKTKTISNCVTHMCTGCGESVVDNASLKESGKILKDFKREVDGLLTGQQIKEIRLKLGLTQEQLADIVGGGLKSVARYESGQVCQSKGMDNLLRILDAYPETLKIIQKKTPSRKNLTKIVYLEDVRNHAYRLPGKPFSTETWETGYGS